jgi:hypothetical protein
VRGRCVQPEVIVKNSNLPGASGHTCNPSYLGGRDQKDYSSKPTWVNRSHNPISKMPNTKKS